MRPIGGLLNNFLCNKILIQIVSHPSRQSNVMVVIEQFYFQIFSLTRIYFRLFSKIITETLYFLSRAKISDLQLDKGMS
jgi:hypothetical protein